MRQRGPFCSVGYAICSVVIVGFTGASGCSGNSASHLGGDGSVGNDGGTSDPTDGMAAVAPDGDRYPLPADAGQSGFLTWSYHGQPVGLYLPPLTGKPVPIVMFLHGCKNNPVDPSWWIIAALNKVEPCAVLLPFRPAVESPTCSAWGGTYDEDLRASMVDALAGLDSVVAQYGLDSKRQYLYGESMGAEGVLKLLVQLPDRFAGAVSVAGYTLDKGAQQMAKTPLWLIQGSADTVNKPESITTIYDSILKAGGTLVKLTEYPGLDHNPSIVKARSESCVLDWLLAQRHDGVTRLGTCAGNDAGSATGLFKLEVKGLDASYEGKFVGVALIPGVSDCGPAASAAAYMGQGAITAGACTLSITDVPNGAYTVCSFIDLDGDSMPGSGDVVNQVSVAVSGDTTTSLEGGDWTKI